MEWIHTIVESRLLSHTVIAAIIMVVLYFLTRPARALLAFIGHHISRRTATELDDRILAVVLRHVRLFMVLLGLLLAVHEVRKGVLPQELTLQDILDYAGGVTYVLLIVLFVKVAVGTIREVVDWYLARVSTDGTSRLIETIGPLTNKLIGVLMLFVATIIVLDHFGVNIGSLLVSLGVGSLAVALAAQDTLSNMIAGFVILVDRPFRVGDRLELASGQVGDVKEIGLRSTRVVNFDNNTIIIPNAELIRNRVVNYSYPHLAIRVLLRFEVQYGTDPGNVRGILLGLAANQPGLLKDPPPRVDVTGMTASSIQLTFSARYSEYTKQGDVESSLREQAYSAFLKAGIKAPIQETIVHAGKGS